MKLLLMIFFLTLPTPSFAGVPYCNVAEIINGGPSMDSVVAEYAKSQELEIVMKNGAARAEARWDKIGQFYQMSLIVDDVRVNGITELPGKSGFLNLLYKGRNFSAQCRFEL